MSKLPGKSQRTDEDIAAAAVSALKWNILVPAGKIKVTVRDGWVILEGEVEMHFQKNAAERAVSDLPGVKGVNNLIRIKPGVAPSELKAKIEDAFKRSAELHAKRVAVEIEGSKVTLRCHRQVMGREGSGPPGRPGRLPACSASRTSSPSRHDVVPGQGIVNGHRFRTPRSASATPVIPKTKRRVGSNTATVCPGQPGAPECNPGPRIGAAPPQVL